ncbi:methyl-accepting chemotaxis protein [Caldimonas aquatica]|uniref:methyl-accepting chemotaxis protein n=1 Tax=Caldimonas aquatica TaxID=376175 RepID=UPI0024753895|nr:methyl-accepting chemotaxis protein [Schlegelella aquatica]
MKIGRKLWLATALLTLSWIGAVGLSGVRSAASTRYFETHQQAHEAKVGAWLQWRAHTDAQDASLPPSVPPEPGTLNAVLAGWQAQSAPIAAALQQLQGADLAADEKQALATALERRSRIDDVVSRARQLAQAGDAEGAARLLAQEVPSRLAAARQAQQAVAESLARSAQAFKAEFKAQRETTIALAGGWAALVFVLLIGGTAFLVRSLRGGLQQAVEAARHMAGGDLSRPVPPGGRDEVGEMLRALAALQASLQQIVSEVKTSTDSITTASTEIASGNQDLSSRTEQAASNLQQTASSMEQLTGTVKQSADAAAQANQLACSASEVATRGGQVVSQVVATMDEINAASKKIADIIGVIDGIAFQTNILALNAAVEAARAGEQGRGFAVVAGEVRNLAQRSAQAAKEIKTLIGASVEKVESGAELVQDAGSTMSEIVASVQRVTDIIGEISAAAAEQNQGIGQINTAVNQLDQMTQQNAALVEESAAAAESLKEQAHRLAEVVAAFKLAHDAREQAQHLLARAAQPQRVLAA